MASFVDEDTEVRDLKTLFHSPQSRRATGSPDRASDLSVTLAARLKEGERAWEVGDTARATRQELRELKQAAAQSHRELAQRSRDTAYAARRHAKQVAETTRQRKLQLVRAVKADEKTWQAQRAEAQAAVAKEARQKVEAAAGDCKSLDARLDAQEARAARAAQQEAKRQRESLAAALVSARNERINRKRERVMSVKKQAALMRESKLKAEKARADAAGEKREAAREWQQERKQNEEGHLSKARAFKAEVNKARSNAKAREEEMLTARKTMGQRDRSFDEARTVERSRRQQDLRDRVAETYRKSFVSAEEEDYWARSPLLKWFPQVHGLG